MKIISTYGFILVFLLGFGFLHACKKDKVPTPTDPLGPTKWEKISGYYKVYDTNGVYMYDMNIIHIHNEEDNIDSLRFENFDGEFNFVAKQENPSNYPMYVRIGSHDTLYDTQLKRWKLGSGIFNEFNNYYNDTIPLRFQKTNINYYIEDLTPYYACDCKQIAVKQH